MPHKTEPLPRPAYAEALVANAKHKSEFFTRDGRRILVFSDRPLKEALIDAFRAAIRNCKPVPSITK